MSPADPALLIVLRRLRARAGISQEALTFESDLAVSAMACIERGKINPAWSNVRAITRALGVSMSELVATLEQERH